MKLLSHVHFRFPKVIIKLLNSGNLKPPAVRSRYSKKHKTNPIKTGLKQGLTTKACIPG